MGDELPPFYASNSLKDKKKRPKKKVCSLDIRICDGLVPLHLFLVSDFAYPRQLLCGRKTVKSCD